MRNDPGAPVTITAMLKSHPAVANPYRRGDPQWLRRRQKSALSMMYCLLLGMMHTALFLPSDSAARQEGMRENPPGLFSADTPLRITLTGPWREFKREKDSSVVYSATLNYTDKKNVPLSMPLKVEPRGITRLKVCKFPPAKLVLDKQAIKGTAFRGNKSLKLVTHCANGERWARYPVREMLAYRIFNLITERSFRVRPLSVTYVDSVHNDVDGPHFAFLIEDDSALAKRNDLEKLDIPKPRLSQLDPVESNRFALFQFLIGNTDWAVLAGPSPDRCCHNSELIGAQGKNSIFAVPYDFDSSGLVDAHYAAPNALLPIQSNRERLYRGFCVNNASLETVRQEFLLQETRILALFRNEIGLAASSREAAQAYLTKGFDILRDDGKFAALVTGKCRK